MDYASMLLCQSGYSAEKVVDVVQRWPTHHALWTDLDRKRRQVEVEQDEFDEQERTGTLPKSRKKPKRPTGEDYIAEQIGRDSSRSVKGALSKQAWELYTSLKY